MVFSTQCHGSSELQRSAIVSFFFVHDAKEDFRLKARLVAGGHVLPPPLESVCSGVVSLRSVRLMCFIAELNGLDLCQGDVSNACLESCCTALLCFIAGPEFGQFEGHTMLVIKALHGLHESGKNWATKFGAIMKEEGWEISKADPKAWMKRLDDHCEHVGSCVDDL